MLWVTSKLIRMLGKECISVYFGIIIQIEFQFYLKSVCSFSSTSFTFHPTLTPTQCQTTNERSSSKTDWTNYRGPCQVKIRLRVKLRPHTSNRTGVRECRRVCSAMSPSPVQPSPISFLPSPQKPPPSWLAARLCVCVCAVLLQLLIPLVQLRLCQELWHTSCPHSINSLAMYGKPLTINNSGMMWIHYMCPCTVVGIRLGTHANLD